MAVPGDPDLRIFECTTYLRYAEPGAGVPYHPEAARAEYEAGHNVGVFERLKECGIHGKEALLAGDLEGFGAVMNANWAAQKALHPEITTPYIEELHEKTCAAGALGFKANGAGGGGTVTILAQRNRDHHVRTAVEELGMTVLPSKLDSGGLRVWEVP